MLVLKIRFVTRLVGAGWWLVLWTTAVLLAGEGVVHQQTLDALVRPSYPKGEPGAAVLVKRGEEILLRRGYGMADLELGVAIEPDMLFRLGSLTKQFTAVGILMLCEAGKLDLNSRLTELLPEYPRHPEIVNTVTVEHLLNHTSGIASYTGLAAWQSLQRSDLSVTQMIDLFKSEPFDFAPGTQYRYNNSGYFLLGAIIEKRSGLTYDAFIETRIFRPAGMDRSLYDRADPIVKGRVRGYRREGARWVNAAYLSMTQPYSAGSLMSSLDDLIKWDAALDQHQFISKESFEKMRAPLVLTNGEMVGYGYGLGIATYEGRRALEHGGGINGFVSHFIKIPEDKILVAVLSNREGDWTTPSELCRKIVKTLLAKSQSNDGEEPHQMP